MNKKYYILFINLLFFCVILNCIRQNNDPVGPSVWILSGEDRHHFIRTAWHLSFTGVSNIESFADGYENAADTTPPRANKDGETLAIWFTNLPAGTYAEWRRPLTNALGSMLNPEKGDVLGLSLRVRSSNEGTNFMPQMLRFIIWDNIGPNTQFEYNFGLIPATWTNINVIFIDLTPDIINNIGQGHIGFYCQNSYENTTYGGFIIDEIKLQVWRNIRFMDPTEE